MKTLTLTLPDASALHLEILAQRRGITQEEFVREWVEEKLQDDDDGPSAYDLMKDGCGIIESDVPDLASNPKHMEGFGR
jgi:hypothetical protein